MELTLLKTGLSWMELWELLRNSMSWIEWIATLLGLVYVVLLIRENIWCWPAGILSSGLSVWLFVEVKLYAEAFLYCFYVLIGFYGWWVWRKRQDSPRLKIRTWPAYGHAVAIGLVALLSMGLGYGLDQWTDAERPFVDAQSTGFSFFASYLEAQKILGGWIYWIVINVFSVWLYADRGLQVYTGLMVLNAILSVAGYLSWRKLFHSQASE